MFVLIFVVPYYLVVVCIRKLMMRQENMVEEVELGQTRPTEEKIADVGPVPLSGAPIIKEHI
jgi:hypothetical protein